MTERLRKVIAQIEQLPETDQDAYALALEADLASDRRFSEAMNDPHELVLDQLLAEAKEQVAQGKARPLDDLL